MHLGSCLCKAVTYEIRGKLTDIYQCHCSVCRKAFSAGGCSVCLTSGEDFVWKSGEEHIRLWISDTGYRSTFCGICGTHLPDPDPEKTTYWVPAGTLDERDPGIRVGAHVYVDSKAEWDVIGDDGVRYHEGFDSPEIKPASY